MRRSKLSSSERIPSMRERFSSGSPYESESGFSRAIRIGRRVLVAGTAPLDAEGRTAAVGDPAGQARRCFEIIAKALSDAGARMEDVVRTRLFLCRSEDWKSVAAVHGEFFRGVRPVATAVVVRGLLEEDWLVEIEAEAEIPDVQQS